MGGILPQPKIGRTGPRSLGGAGEGSELDGMVAQVLGDGREFGGGAAPEPLQLVRGEDHRWCGTALLMVRAKFIALPNSGRTSIRVLILSAKTGHSPPLEGRRAGS
ncbi:hypothetical protein ACFV6E_40825 [Streptomyces sp. NPDC059785]|uniref:hypothetical protein n=1 Tax=Streptomyces sp. NPDC059785 TaxID=3346945 RepID=UPI00365B8FA8